MTTRFVGPSDGHYAAFQPGAANSIGYDDLKVIEAAHLLTSIATGTQRGPAWPMRSARTLCWTP